MSTYKSKIFDSLCEVYGDVFELKIDYSDSQLPVFNVIYKPLDTKIFKKEYAHVWSTDEEVSSRFDRDLLITMMFGNESSNISDIKVMDIREHLRNNNFKFNWK